MEIIDRGQATGAQAAPLSPGIGRESRLGSLVACVDLALAGEPNRPEVDPVAQPVRCLAQVDSGRHGDSPIDVSFPGRGQEGRFDFKLFQGQVVGPAMEPGGKRGGIAERQRLVAALRFQAR